MNRIIVTLLILLSFTSSFCASSANAATIDKVIAYIDDTAITQRELDAAHEKNIKQSLTRTKDQTLEALINTTLIRMEAKKLRLKAPDNSSLVKQYMELKVRALIFVREADVKDYYKDNLNKFKNASYDEVSGEIRKYLTELRYNEKLKQHMRRLRAKSHIRILEQP